MRGQLLGCVLGFHHSAVHALIGKQSEGAAGVDINTPPISMHFTRKHAVRPPRNAASVSGPASADLVTNPSPSSSVIPAQADVAAVLASLLSPSHALAPSLIQTPAINAILSALVQHTSSWSPVR